MIPAYLANLQLPQVFAAYCASVDSYIIESTSDEHVVDSESQRISGFVSDSFGQAEDAAGKYFAVENPSGQSYALLQVDNGIIKTSATKKCDCALGNDTHLCFIEFKANANSEKTSTIQKNYRKAMEQLTTTIGFFDNYMSACGLDIRSLRTTEAFICFRQGYPRKTSSQMNYQVAFATANNGIPLSFERKKVL